MRLLMVTQDFPPRTGGIQTYSLELAKRLATRSRCFELICPHAPGAEEVDAQLAFRVHRVRGGSDLFPALAAPSIARIVRQRRIDVMFHVQWQTAPIGALLRRAHKLRTLAVAVHGKELLLQPFSRPELARRAYDRLRATPLETADVVLPVSEFAAGLLRRVGLGHTRTTVVPNGVDATRMSGGDGAAFRARHGLGDARVLLTVARLYPRKGVDTVIRCLPALLRRVPDLHYVVVGEGPDLNRLQGLALEHGVRERVHLLGRLEHDALRDGYSACDAFVLAGRDEPQSVEGFGLVLLEASSCACPTVATSAGGMSEAVQHERTGLVVPTGDHDALVHALTRVLSDRELAVRLGAAGRDHARMEASWDRAAQNIHRALERA
jgi:phosphatidylinositol alpha-1,6-mannosyltransferase